MSSQTAVTSSDPLLNAIASEMNGSVADFVDGVKQMAGVIEATFHVVEKLREASDGSPSVGDDDVDLVSIAHLLKAARLRYPPIYAALTWIEHPPQSGGVR